MVLAGGSFAILVSVPVSYGKKLKGKATRLHSLYVRMRANYTCQRCGKTREEGQIQCAHIISRQLVATRTDERNAFALCASCHHYFSKWPIEFAKFVEETVGLDLYDELKALTEAKHKPDWEQEVERLESLIEQLEHENTDRVPSQGT